MQPGEASGAKKGEGVGGYTEKGPVTQGQESCSGWWSLRVDLRPLAIQSKSLLSLALLCSV